MYGTTINVSAKPDSILLLESADHAILEPNIMVLTVCAILDTSVIGIYVLLAIKAAVNVAVPMLTNVKHVLMYL